MFSDKNNKRVGCTLFFCYCVFLSHFLRKAGIRNNYINIIDVPNIKSCGEFMLKLISLIFIYFEVLYIIRYNLVSIIVSLKKNHVFYFHNQQFSFFAYFQIIMKIIYFTFLFLSCIIYFSLLCDCNYYKKS